MNHYTIGEIAEGARAEFSATVTEEMFAQFLALSGDTNPLHNNEGYAKALGHRGRVAYGMLVASFYSTLAGVYLPGEHCLLHEVRTKFKKPVYAGDTLTISGTVVSKSAAARQIEIKAEIKNQNGERVNVGTIFAGVGE